MLVEVPFTTTGIVVVNPIEPDVTVVVCSAPDGTPTMTTEVALPLASRVGTVEVNAALAAGIVVVTVCRLAVGTSIRTKLVETPLITVGIVEVNPTDPEVTVTV